MTFPQNQPNWRRLPCLKKTATDASTHDSIDQEAYEKEIAKANLDKLAQLNRICGFLLQTKACLFWQNLVD